MEQHAEVLIGGTWRQRIPTWRDAVATLLVLTIIILVGLGARDMAAPFAAAHQPRISSSPAELPYYALRTTMRMLAALVASLIFTFVYATPAAKSPRAERVLIPLLDVLQSVPVLGYLSITVVFFIAMFPGSTMGPELAAIFAIFTAQAWNMAFSFFQSLITIPTDLEEASRSFRLSAWQRFWRLEVPFAMPGLVWNMMMSMSGGWFFVVASEAISVGNIQIALPGIGSYVALAIARRDLAAVGWAIVAMTITIVIYDQLLFRPLVAWSDKFRFEQTAAQVVPRSWMLDLFRGANLWRVAATPLGNAMQQCGRMRLALPHRAQRRISDREVDVIWYGSLLLIISCLMWRLVRFAAPGLAWDDVAITLSNGFLTFVRVTILIVLATIVWVPIGVGVGLRPRLAQKVQPVAQFLAAFPANLLFPIAVYLIVRFHLTPKIWLSPLMILGTQWYILFNVIAGATAFPGDFREAAASFRIRGVRWWREVILPGIFPYYVTGAITASGGAWNASIVSEAINWGSTTVDGGGLGAYIARMTVAGDFPRIALGVAVMSVFVIAMNRLIWRPLYAFAERRTRLA
ncbi:MAG TPA: ABC transporter permease subunit [Candidatus Binataceae bacterium]|nr:ABC transporter permease subunit [Candidatus Binataceae bacterium]